MVFKYLKNKFNSYEELESFIKSLNINKDKGDCFEEFAYLYFVANKDIYDIKEIYMENDIPAALREKYKLEITDNGVDGLIITNSGESIAYQVKFRSDNSTATYSDLATFWAESEYCDSRCIFSNCLQLPTQSDKKKNQFQILLDTFLTLDADFFELIYNIANNNTVAPIEKYKPRDHQKKIIEDVIKGFEENDRGKIICACGTGKTLTSLWIKEKMESNNTLFVVPSLALVRQTLVEWKKQASVPFKHIVVCSDVTINENEGEVVFEETSSSNIPVTTDSCVVENFLKSEGNHIVFSTYQSLDVVAAALVNNDFSFDMAIFDEAHRTAGTSDSNMFSLGLSDEFIRSRKRLFMTATEKVVSPRIKKLSQETDYTIFSMDDEKVYGPVFSRLDFGMAIEQNIISDYKVLLSVIKSSEIDELLKTRELLTANGEDLLDSNILLKQLILAKAINNLDIRKVITYHSTVAQAKSFTFGSNRNYPFETVLDNIMNVDNNKCYFSHVNGTMSSNIRSKIFKEFKDADISLLTNASCLTEGVDIPIIDAVYFVEPKNSIINIIQAIGRALRKSKDKKVEYSYIILPVIIDDSVNSFDEIDAKSFDTLHMVIQALRDQDSRLKEEIDALNYKVATHSTHSTNLSGHLDIWVPQSINLDDFSNALSLRIADVNKNSTSTTPRIVEVEDRSSSFTRVFRTIGDYNVEAYGNIVIPTIEKFANVNDELDGKDLAFNHNNVSHTEKIGLIESTGNRKFKLTKLGKEFYNSDRNFNELFKRQALKYFEFNDNTTSILFPYRSFLRVMKEFDRISRLEFLYSIYTLKGSSLDDEKRSIDIINDIRSTYPNIEILSEENKKKVLNILNVKYGTAFNYGDIWTSRTTTYNQFNYFKKHTLAFGNIFSGDSSEIIKAENGNELIDELLSMDSSVDNMQLEELKKYYTE